MVLRIKENQKEPHGVKLEFKAQASVFKIDRQVFKTDRQTETLFCMSVIHRHTKMQYWQSKYTYVHTHTHTHTHTHSQSSPFTDSIFLNPFTRQSLLVTLNLIPAAVSGLFLDTCRVGKTLNDLIYIFPAEIQEGNVLSSCFSSHTVNMSLLWSIQCHVFCIFCGLLSNYIA